LEYNVRELRQNEGDSVELDEKLALDTIEHGGERLQLIGPVAFKGTLGNVAGGLILKGRVSLELKTYCHRCLEDVLLPLEFDMQERFSHTESQDDDTYRIEKDTIDLETVILDNIELNLPARFLCREDCRGLCPVCGTNRNKDKCSCRVEDMATRLEVLKNFFKK